MSRIISTTILCIFSLLLNGQYATNLIPRISSDNSISERVAYTEISIQYGSPKVKGRKIWGDMQHYDQIWRAGANHATVIEFSEDVKVKGQNLLKGKYALFVIPRENEDWTIIFNKQFDQWGAFDYKQEEDALRIAVSPRFVNHVEDLTYDIVANDFEGAKVSLAWERVKLNFNVEVEYLKILEERVNENIKMRPQNISWVIYLQGAEYLVDKGEKLNLAQEWLDKSENLKSNQGEWSGQYYPKVYIVGNLYWCKAKLAAAQQDYSAAINYSNQLKELKGDYLFYDRENEAEQIDAKIANWSAKL